MLNAMPLPTVPAEIPGGSLKNGPTTPASEKASGDESWASFASTLETINAEGPSGQSTPDTASEETLETVAHAESQENLDTGNENTRMVGVGMVPILSLQTPAGNEADMTIPSIHVEDGSQNPVALPLTGSNATNETDGSREIAMDSPKTRPHAPLPTAQPAPSSDSHPKASKENGGVQEPMTSDGKGALPAGAENVPGGKGGAGIGTSQGGDEAIQQAFQVMDKGTDRRKTKETPPRQVDLSVSKTPKPNAEPTMLFPSGDDRSLNAVKLEADPSKSMPRGDGRSSNAVTLETDPSNSSPSGDGRSLNAVTLETDPSKPLRNGGDRPWTTADATGARQNRGGTVHQTIELKAPITPEIPTDPHGISISDDGNPNAGRQASFDATLNMTTAPTGGKTTVNASIATVKPEAAPDIFPRDNIAQMVERAVITLRDGQSEARIALKPDHLGHVQMRIVTESNLVNVKIITESIMARELIEANAHHLKTELQQQGLNVDAIEVSVSDERQDGYRGLRQKESQSRQTASHNPSASEEEDPSGENGDKPQHESRPKSTGIDYFA